MSLARHALRAQVAAQARYRCGYCLTQEVVSGIPLTLEHLVPRALGGADTEENLWLSCRLCNESKGVHLAAIDPDTGIVVSLFNPRTDQWSEHFGWSEEGTRMFGRTAMGRATIAALSLNAELRVRSRAIWVEVGYHPPK